MNREQLLSELERHVKTVRDIVRLLRDINKLESDRSSNLMKIKKQVRRLRKEAAHLTPLPVDDLEKWIVQFESELRQTEERVKKRFGAKLKEALQPLGLTLTGQYPELGAGLFTIELDFDQWQATLWYGRPKQEKIETCPLSVPHLVKCIERAKKELGSCIPEQELLEKLHQAYKRTDKNADGFSPIINVLGEMAYLLQSPRFHQDPRKENYKSYSRADFSFDLFRLRRFLSQNPHSLRLRLRTATRTFTRRRSGFLWVPENEDGTGSTYSHLKFEER